MTMRQNISIEGMGCDHCVATVRAALEKADGVTVEHVEIGTARVEIESGRVSDAQIDAAIREAGYEPTSHEMTLGA